MTDHKAWQRAAASRTQERHTLGAQFSNDRRFTHGTIADKRVSVVGTGNIGNRYASLRADVEPCRWMTRCWGGTMWCIRRI